MKEKILQLIYNSEGYLSGQQISESLGISRQAVNKAVKGLRDKGFEIESATNKGYKLISLPVDLCAESINLHLKTKFVGRNIRLLDTVGSTNDYLKALAEKGAEAGTVVLSREQTSGKGRLGRSWMSKRDETISMSILLRPDMMPSEIASITPLAGLAMCRAVNDFCMLDSRIKWPNDIIVGRKKLVGILTEMASQPDKVEYTVTGIGINVSNTSFPDEIAHKATSILLETGRHIDRNKFVATALNYLEQEIVQNRYRLGGEAVAEYQRLCATIGRQVTFARGKRNVSGMAVSVSNNGELGVMLSNGTVVTVNAGEVTVQGIY